jgi:hypothetical protein
LLVVQRERLAVAVAVTVGNITCSVQPIRAALCLHMLTLDGFEIILSDDISNLAHSLKAF